MTNLRTGYQQQGGFAWKPQASVTSPAATTPTVLAPPVVAAPALDPLQDQLHTLDQVLTEIEQTKATTTSPLTPAEPVVEPAPVVEPVTPLAHVVPQVVTQATDTLNVAYGRPAAKETVAATAPVETAASIQYVEEEKVPEIPVEVESYLHKVEQQEIQLPNEIVIADTTNAPLPQHLPKQPVIVLPITPEIEARGARQNPFQSLRWLVEWSRKIMKMFTGKVVYREVASS